MDGSKLALITGAGRGIGRASAIRLAEDGFDIVINYVSNRDAAEQTASKVEACGQRAWVVRGSVAIEKDVLRLFATIDSDIGQLDALVNNAGVLFQQMPVEKMSFDRIERTLAVNVIGSMLCAREAVKRMATDNGGKGGSIVNVSSIAATLGGANEYVDYAASKGAIDTFTVGLAKEVAARGIRVNAVRPGVINTEIHASGGEPGRVERVKQSVPMQRGGEPEEVANAIAWLISDAARYCTATSIDISGGR